MVEGTIGDRVRPLWSFFTVLHWGGIDSHIFGSSLGDTIIVCSFDFCLYPWLARMFSASYFVSYYTFTIHALHSFGHKAQ
jgi:hypothetical protein